MTTAAGRVTTNVVRAEFGLTQLIESNGEQQPQANVRGDCVGGFGLRRSYGLFSHGQHTIGSNAANVDAAVTCPGSPKGSASGEGADVEWVQALVAAVSPSAPAPIPRAISGKAPLGGLPARADPNKNGTPI